MKKMISYIVFIACVVLISILGRFLTRYSWGPAVSTVLFFLIVGGGVYYFLSGMFKSPATPIIPSNILYTEEATIYTPIWFYFLTIPGAIVLAYSAYYFINLGKLYNYIIGAICIFFVIAFIVVVFRQIYSKAVKLTFTDSGIISQSYNAKPGEIKYESITEADFNGNILKLQLSYAGLTKNTDFEWFGTAPIYFKIKDIDKVKAILGQHNVGQLTK